MELKEIMSALEETKSKFLAESASQTEKTVKEAIDKIDAKLAEIKSLPEGFDAAKLQADFAETVKGFNELQTSLKQRQSTTERKSFGKMLMEGVKENFEAIQAASAKRGTFCLNLKDAGVMTLGNNLTGDGVATYASRQAILPAQAINLRDLFPTSSSPTGLYVQYKESGGEGTFGKQTEGQAKDVVDYDLTEVKTVSSYVAGITTFSKQMMKQLPFFETTLPRLLQRDFFKKENALGFAALAAGTGVTTTTATDDIEQMIQLIANQKTANFNASVALISEKQMGRLIISTYNKGYYAGAGAVQIVGQGLTIWGVPVIGATWVTDDKCVIVDNNYFERVETESMNVVFSFEANDGFNKNLVSARLECMEEWNLMLPTAAIYADFGNAS